MDCCHWFARSAKGIYTCNGKIPVVTKIFCRHIITIFQIHKFQMHLRIEGMFLQKQMCFMLT